MAVADAVPLPQNQYVRITMKKFIIYLFCALYVFSCKPNMPEKQYNASCLVSDSAVIAKIPIIYQDVYKYYLDTSPRNVMEFGCIISIENYDFGFRLFKFGMKEKKGSLKDLFSDGQTNIWRIEGSKISVVERHGVKIDFSEPYIIFRIVEQKTINLLFKERPSSCSFSLFGFNAPQLNGDIKIKYE